MLCECEYEWAQGIGCQGFQVVPPARIGQRTHSAHGRRKRGEERERTEIRTEGTCPVKKKKATEKRVKTVLL